MHIAAHRHPSSLKSPTLTDGRPTRACVECDPVKSCFASFIRTDKAEQFEKLLFVCRRVPRHSSLYCEKDQFEMLYVVRFGHFKLLRVDAADEQRVAHFYMPGDLVGVNAIGTDRHNFTLMALENSEVFEGAFKAISMLIAAAPNLQRDFLKLMRVALNDQNVRSSMLALPSLDERLANFLLQLSERYGRLGYSKRSFRLIMTRDDIGSYLGTTVERVSRVISRFNTQGACFIAGRTVELRNPAFLHSILGNCDDGIATSQVG